ncbi:GTP cyclohydrolase I FolE [Lacticaseibacillus baoqingensis]|uniref:GTP cyclohydrolase 1 n=1 Tax=Lacticaseibacillus baoqingensis TaxID=2486013 RepID=A0ABW4E4N8_9LACO|nr:GTP cyclohydrolase I FolE [Lacticaseibacillus baoqingensis]
MDKQRIENAVKELLAAVGEDVDRPGLVETPERVARMYAEVFGSLDQPEAFQDYKVFPVTVDPGLVMVQQIPFYSMCEHHLLPFFGHVTIGYLPSDKKIIGLSKLGRLVDFVARRPNVQEAMTSRIVGELQRILHPQGIAVSVVARHMCMEMRGINRGDLFTYTSRYTGVFETDLAMRREFQEEARRSDGNC